MSIGLRMNYYKSIQIINCIIRRQNATHQPMISILSALLLMTCLRLLVLDLLHLVRCAFRHSAAITWNSIPFIIRIRDIIITFD